MLRLIRDFPLRFRRITSGGTYRPEIDGLRLFAIALVIFAHLWERAGRMVEDRFTLSPTEAFAVVTFNSGTQGVLLFFAISGFIIANQWKRGQPDIKAYFLRRVSRIEPPYLLLITAIFLIITVTGYRPAFARDFNNHDVSLLASYIASFFYVHGVLFVDYPRLLPPGWSLEIEVQFYIVAPLLFMAYHALPRRLWFGWLALAAGTAISLAADAAWGDGPHRFTIIKYFPFFWIGVLLADMNLSDGKKRTFYDLAGLIGLIVLVLANNKVGIWLNIDRSILFVARLAAIVAMFAGATRGKVFRAFCSLPWIAVVGGACYSLYLTHLPVAAIATQILAKLWVPDSLPLAYVLCLVVELPVMLVVGLGFYVLVERPFMRPHWVREARDLLASLFTLGRHRRARKDVQS